MKTLFSLVLAGALTTAVFTAAAYAETDPKEIVVGASTTPHAEILKVAEDALKEKGYTLKIVEFEDYVQPNLSLESKELDANYFQHQPYLDDFNKNNNTSIVSAAAIHYEPLGIYAGKTSAIADLKDGAEIAVPNDTTNEARALLLLEAQGLIKVKPDAGLHATIQDMTENPKNLKIIEIEAAQLARQVVDGLHHDDQFQNVGLVPRAVAEIRADRVLQGRPMRQHRGAQPFQPLPAQGKAGRPVAQKGAALRCFETAAIQP